MKKILMSLLVLGAGSAIYSMDPAEKSYSVKDLMREGNMPKINDAWKELDLQKLGLTSLEGLQEFPQAEQVTALWLDDNPLKEVPAGILDRFVNLEKLSLQHISLDKIDPQALVSLSKLKELYLSDNNLTELPVDLVGSAPCLEVLYLERNALREIPSTLFNINSLLKTVLLKGNQIPELPPEVIERFKKQSTYTDHPSIIQRVKEYSIAQLLEDLRKEGKVPADLVEPSGPNLFVLNLSSLGLTSLEGIEALKGLEVYDIDLSNNYISHIPEGCFSGFRECILWLHLDGNQLRVLPKELVGINVSLFELTIRDNQFTELPDLTPYRKLSDFDATGNKIMQLKPNSFAGNSNLTTIYLQRNKIEAYPPSLLDGLDRLEELDLSHNLLGNKEAYQLPTVGVSVDAQDSEGMRAMKEALASLKGHRGLIFEPQDGVPSLSVLSMRAFLPMLQGMSLEEIIAMIAPLPKKLRDSLIESAPEVLRRILRSANAIIDANRIIATTYDKGILLATIKKLSPQELQLLLKMSSGEVASKVKQLND